MAVDPNEISGGLLHSTPLADVSDIATADTGKFVLITSDGKVRKIPTNVYAKQSTVEGLPAAVQAIEAKLGLKVDDAYLVDGYMYMESEGQVIIGPLGPFSSEVGLAFDTGYMDAEGYLHLTLNGEDIEGFTPFYVGTGGGGGSVSTVIIRNLLPTKDFTISDGAACVIEYSWESKDSSGASTGSTGTATWRVGSNIVAVQNNMIIGDHVFDMTQYLQPGTNAVKLTMEDEYGSSRSYTWNVTVSTFSLTWNLDMMSNHDSNSVLVRINVSGAGEKTVYIKVDNNIVSTTTNAGRTVSYTIPAQSHGSHVVTAWMEAHLDTQEEPVVTEPLRHIGVWTQAGVTLPVFAVYQDSFSAKQYSTSQIIWMVINPVSEYADVSKYEDNSLITTETVNSGEIQYWAYRSTQVGQHVLRLSCQLTDKLINADIISVGYDINPVTENLIMDSDPTGWTNSRADRDQFGYYTSAAHTQMNPFTFSSNFDWNAGGFVQDEEGVTALLIKRGTYIDFDRSFFNDNARLNGKEIKIIFKVSECRDYSTQVLDCFANNIGLRCYANEAILSSSGTSRTIPYCEETKLEMDINISANSEDRIATVWLEGVPSRALPYADNEWEQTSPQNVRIGSNEADVWLYRVKMYSTSLTRADINQNFVADCSNVDEMILRYERNDIFTDSRVDIQKLANRNPALRIIHITADRMTTGKKDNVPCKVELIYGDGTEAQQFVGQDVIMKAQGTSSLEYIASALNLDLDFKNATSWKNGLGEDITEYAYTDSDWPVKYMNLKLNVASSENANNACFQDDYNNYQPNLTKIRRDDPKNRDTMHGYPCAIFFTNSSDSAIDVGSRHLEAGETILYGNGDLMNSKKNWKTFGHTDTYPDVCCIEIKNNNKPQVRFKSDDLTTETWDGNEDTCNFEFRYPDYDDPLGPESKRFRDLFQEVLSWVVSTDPLQATNTVLSTPVTYGGIQYTNDTADYRKAKFKAEVGNYFQVDSLTYHYLFTERHLLTDNRAKNTFISYEPDQNGVYKWNFNKDYDNDTGDGNDNSGGLTFTYGMEDTDMVGASYVFNAHDSVLWCNVRDCLSDQLKAMYINRKSAGAWDADRILAKFNAYQSPRPEALVAEDMYGKYYMPYIVSASNERYLSKMYGNKTDQRKQFETYQAEYMDQKYIDLTSRDDTIEFRLNAPESYAPTVPPSGNIIDVVPYTNTYLNAMFGNAGTYRVRATRGVAYTLVCPPDAALNDLETYLFGASNITHIGSMAALYSKFVDSAKGKKLQELLIGSGERGYTNTGMTSEAGGVGAGSNTYCEVIDLRGLTRLTQALDLSQLVSLEEIYITNSGITGLTFAKGCPLRIAQLGSNLTTLKMWNLNKLTTFEMNGARLQSIIVENCPLVNTKSLVESASGLSRGRITGVTPATWTFDDASTLLRLSTLKGFDALGENTEKFVLTGEVYVTALTQYELDTLTAYFPDLTINYGAIVEAVTVRFVNYDGTLLNSQTVHKYGAVINPIGLPGFVAPTKEPTVDTVYTFTGWDDTSVFVSVSSDTTVTAQFSGSTRYYTVKWYAHDILLDEQTVPVYNSAIYAGTTPQTQSDDELWRGWDKSAVNVTSDLNIYATYIVARMPEAVKKGATFIYSDIATDNMDYTAEEFWGIWYYNGKEVSGVTINAKDYFDVGGKIKMDTSSSGAGKFADTTIECSLIGWNHFKLTADSTKFATGVWHMVGLMNATHNMNSSNTNVGGWPSCGMRTFVNTTLLSGLPPFWQGIMKEVTVRSTAGNQQTTVVVSQDKLFLLSYAEVGFDGGAPYNSEYDPDAEIPSGATYAKFSVFTDNNSRIKKYNNGTGSASYWWLRSPTPSGPTYFWCVYGNGNSNYYGASNATGVAVGFCT